MVSQNPPQDITETQSAILLELQKILWTVNQINTSLKKTLALTKPAPSPLPIPPSQSQHSAAAEIWAPGGGVDVKEVGALVKALNEAIDSGKGVFGRALGVDEGGSGDGDGGGQEEEGQEEEEEEEEEEEGVVR